MVLGKYSIGLGDRFGHQGVAQLCAVKRAQTVGLDVVPVWNKSYREHTIIHTRPADTRAEADAAVKALDWDEPYFVDADHVSLKIIEPFIPVCDFFTLDVADYIGKKADETAIQTFVTQNSKYIGRLSIPSIEQTFHITKDLIRSIGEKYLYAIEEANRIYQHLVEQKGADNFVTEVSMDETDEPQTPVELFFILAALSARGMPVQTIAPKFTGRFNKGVDYIGDLEKFTREFEQDVAVIQFAIREFSLPTNLKLSVHSGSDKFSLYTPMRTAIQKFETGLHIKTAGTTWLEELIGLALAGGEGLDIARDVYRQAVNRYDELAKPYASVIDMDMRALPSPVDVDGWDGRQYAEILRHDQTNKKYNPHFRQLLHIGYKVAAEMGDRYLNALERYEQVVAENVCNNIYERHLKPLFVTT
ncbi:hypothetical protein EH223_01610 [candidate division KSB1 bacterium]|nr:hypothetical protein [candidate division KSB1 bacterium]RQW06894.1 MAG: hypothetical protein EH223_01610 [candidate division KSB1 bacterium]